MDKKLIELNPDRLLTHPRNMRKFYPADQVREMADSLRGYNGNLQALIIMKDEGDKYLVIDGNMRLAGARLLGDECPPLKCEVVTQEKGDQMLSMIVANQIRYDVDPVSEALHYKQLQEEGMSVRKISKATGIYEARINHRLPLADLDKPIQDLIACGKMPNSPEVAKALLKLPKDTRIRLAMRLSENPSTKISTILTACEKLLEFKDPAKKLKRPAVELSGSLSNSGPVAANIIREAAKKMCQKCNQVEGKIQENDEPAWAMITHAADETCNNCELKDMQRICTMCPAVVLLRNMVKSSGDKNVKR